MSKMGRAMLDRPVLHRARNYIGNSGVDLLAGLHSFKQGFVNFLGQTLAHYVFAEYS